MPGFLGLLTLILITLKLLGYIEWSWLLVFSPLLAGFVLFMAVLALAIFVEMKR